MTKLKNDGDEATRLVESGNGNVLEENVPSGFPMTIVDSPNGAFSGVVRSKSRLWLWVALVVFCVVGLTALYLVLYKEKNYTEPRSVFEKDVAYVYPGNYRQMFIPLDALGQKDMYLWMSETGDGEMIPFALGRKEFDSDGEAKSLCFSAELNADYNDWIGDNDIRFVIKDADPDELDVGIEGSVSQNEVWDLFVPVAASTVPGYETIQNPIISLTRVPFDELDIRLLKGLDNAVWVNDGSTYMVSLERSGYVTIENALGVIEGLCATYRNRNGDLIVAYIDGSDPYISKVGYLRGTSVLELYGGGLFGKASREPEILKKIDVKK